jgi:hypothetical protein
MLALILKAAVWAVVAAVFYLGFFWSAGDAQLTEAEAAEKGTEPK